MDKINILIGGSGRNRRNVKRLVDVVSSWANAENWDDVLMDTTLSMKALRVKLHKFNVGIFLISPEDAVSLCGDGTYDENLFSEMMASFSFIGKKNTYIVLREEDAHILDILGATSFLTYDLSNFETLSDKLERQFNGSISKRSEISVKDQLNALETQKKLIAFNKAVPSEIIAEAISGYSFVVDFNSGTTVDIFLLRGNEGTFLTDNGKTYAELDKIFELSEPDVIKNLVAILKQYNAIKNDNNEVIIEIKSWEDNPNSEENEELQTKIFNLFACISFMLNMKIFYV